MTLTRTMTTGAFAAAAAVAIPAMTGPAPRTQWSRRPTRRLGDSQIFGRLCARFLGAVACPCARAEAATTIFLSTWERHPPCSPSRPSCSPAPHQNVLLLQLYFALSRDRSAGLGRRSWLPACWACFQEDIHAIEYTVNTYTLLSLFAQRCTAANL